MATTREYRWDDEARVLIWPKPEPDPHYHADLASCIRRALDVAAAEPGPDKVVIEHASGMIEIDEIKQMAADPTYPRDPDAVRLRPDSQLP